MFVCLFEAVRTNPGYGMAAVFYNNLLNLILGTVILLLYRIIIILLIYRIIIILLIIIIIILLLYNTGYLIFLDKLYFI